MSTFDLETVTDPSGRTTLKVSGDIDLASAPNLAEGAATYLGGSPDSRLFVDLSGVTFIDSSGLGALVQIHNALAATGGSVVVVAQSHSVDLAMGYAGLSEVFDTGKGP